MDLFSKHTRLAFREHLVGWTLRTISDLFDAADVPYVEIPRDQLPSGERRSLVECYYAGVDWTSPRDVNKILRVYEQILVELNPDSQEFKKLLNLLKRDGYIYEDGTIHGQLAIDIHAVTEASEIVDEAYLRTHVRRLNDSVDSDPAQAIGSSKELLETVAKAILKEFNQDVGAYKTVPQLVKAALNCLELTVENIPRVKEGANSLKQVLAGLSQIVGGIAELRSLYGTGHGRLEQQEGISPRHARLVVGATATLATFLLETLDMRKKEA